MDIDQNQAVKISASGTKMIVDSSVFTIGNKLTIGSQAGSGYKSYLKSFSDIGSDDLKYFVVDEDFHDADHTASHNAYSMAMRLHFTGSKNTFTYWFFSGRGSDDQDYGEQSSGVVM